jgi:predicted hotdog family 3-hydroxylacyl-ACP dehydratase
MLTDGRVTDILEEELATGYAGFAGMRANRFLYHGPPMALLDRVLEVGPDSAICSCIVDEDNPFFCPQQGVPSWVGIEFMAQSIAVSAGARALLACEHLPVGLLLGTMAYRCYIDRFQPTATYLAHCRNLVKDDQGLGAFDCSISLGSETIAAARLTVKELTKGEEFNV